MGVRRFLKNRGFLKEASSPLVSEVMAVHKCVDEDIQRDSPLKHFYCEFPAVSLMREFEDRNAVVTPGVVTNFLGLKIPTEIVPSILVPMSGTKEEFPFPGNWHADIAEWAAALLSVREAETCYRILEIGCGWGCWLNNMGIAAKSRGLNVDLIGVEGDKQHLANAQRTLELNGMQSNEFRLTNGVAAPKNGIVLFPVSDKPGEFWSAEPVFFPDEETAANLRAAGHHTELNCYTLADLSLSKPIDLLHVDIQGSELEFVEGNIDEMSKLVKRVLIGTHSRYLEGCLQEFFLNRGWALEMDRPVICNLVNGKPDIMIDGVLSFRNPSSSAPIF